MSYVELPGVHLWYNDTGGTGTPVIFMHAASGTCQSWVYQLPAFTAAGYRCITYDRRGLGRSRPDLTGEQPGSVSGDLHGLVDELRSDLRHAALVVVEPEPAATVPQIRVVRECLPCGDPVLRRLLRHLVEVRLQRTDVGDGLRVQQHFAARCRACVRVPWDPHLDSGAEATLNGLRPATRNAYLELAAAVADAWHDLIGSTFFVNAVWNLRTKELLGVV